MPDEEWSEYQDLDALEADLSESGGVLTLPAWIIRDAYGAERLGTQVRANITAKLRGRGIGHTPPEFPDRQWTSVRLYKIGSPAGTVIEAALNPGEDGDQVLRDSAGGEAELILSKVRELVCE